MILKSFALGLNLSAYPTSAPPDSLAKMENADAWIEGGLFQRAGLGFPSKVWQGVIGWSDILRDEGGNLGSAVRSFAPVDTGLKTTPTATEG